ncbi:MAG TPA: hypothetical protein VGJ06_03995 [Candidatus Acidoferrum sp.]|jgi:hypothetical protein
MPRHHRPLLTALLILAASILTPAQSPSTPPRTGIAAIESYKGTWKFTSTTLDTAHSKSAKDEKTIRNDCWRSADYYACHQFVDGISQALIVYTYHQDRDLYTTYIVPQDGSAASSGTLQIHGDTWIFPWQVTDNGTTTYYRVVNVFKSATSISFRSEFSTDKVTWTASAMGSEVRVSAE